MNKEKIILVFFNLFALIIALLLFILVQDTNYFIFLITLMITFDVFISIILELYFRVQHNVDLIRLSSNKLEDKLVQVNKKIDEIKVSNLAMVGETNQNFRDLFILQEKLIQLLELRAEKKFKGKK